MLNNIACHATNEIIKNLCSVFDDIEEMVLKMQ